MRVCERSIIDMSPLMCFKTEPPEKLLHHQGLSYTNLYGDGGACVCVWQLSRRLTSKEFCHMVVNTLGYYAEREREESDGGEGDEKGKAGEKEGKRRVIERDGKSACDGERK